MSAPGCLRDALAVLNPAAGRSAVLAVGGDGTAHEVANGLLRAARGAGPTIPLGLVPAGSGNDLARPLGIPGDAAAAARMLLRARPRVVDAGRVGERFFLNGAGAGFDARVVVEAGGIRRLRGVALYGWALVRALRGYRAPRMRVELDGVVAADRTLTLVTVANGPSCGGGFLLCPDARLDDGLLDVLVADEAPARRVISVLLRSLRGAHRDSPGVHLHRARAVLVVGESPFPVHLDGEIVDAAALRVRIEVVPGCLTLLVPGRGAPPGAEGRRAG